MVSMSGSYCGSRRLAVLGSRIILGTHWIGIFSSSFGLEKVRTGNGRDVFPDFVHCIGEYDLYLCLFFFFFFSCVL